jgi:hypothetical protein
MKNSADFTIGQLDSLISDLETQVSVIDPIEIGDSNGASSCCTHSCPC